LGRAEAVTTLRYPRSVKRVIPFKDADPQAAMDRAYSLTAMDIILITKAGRESIKEDVNLAKDYLNICCMAGKCMEERNQLRKKLKEIMKMSGSKPKEKRR
jgi:hypothetical protein